MIKIKPDKHLMEWPLMLPSTGRFVLPLPPQATLFDFDTAACNPPALTSAMSVLSHDEILKAMDSGDIKITPFDPKSVGCASVDLTLSNEFRYYNPGMQVVDVTEATDFKNLTTRVDIADGDAFLLLPGCACLSITTERVTLSPRICGLLEGRSRFARLGLFVHITAGFMNPGIGFINKAIDNRQVLEIYNASNHALRLIPGTKICQFIFMKLEGEGKYNGKFTENVL
eukprot:Phypoly_transcript_16326.p1 GENE.Phypoly_transcript_16326~~Phypoly_transcript_16326.p1  ORF type:complete len:228 (+),score=19.60 Phypoly_transcript_16326:173-856(+)